MTTDISPNPTPKARRQTRYTCCSYKQLELKDGTSVTVRLDIQILVPQDAVLETRVARIDALVTPNRPAPATFNRYPRRGGTINLATEAGP